MPIRAAWLPLSGSAEGQSVTVNTVASLFPSYPSANRRRRKERKKKKGSTVSFEKPDEQQALRKTI